MKINKNELIQSFIENLMNVRKEPEFFRDEEKLKYAIDEEGKPSIKLAIGNMPLDYDLWDGLRNPATVGLHPAGIPEIWEFYANRRKTKVDEVGRPSLFQVPKTFDYAKSTYNRAVIISVMLPFSENIIGDYVSQIIEKKGGSSYTFASMYNDINKTIDKAVTRVAIDMVTDDNEAIVIPMTGENVNALSTEAIPQTKQGISHGPSKGGNYPQKSIGALLGLGQFGISRIVFRDEIESGKVRRYTGPIRSIVVFDKDKLITDGSEDTIFPTAAWRTFLKRLFDFTDTDSEINQYRFCAHLPQNDKGCNKCVESCPSGAQPSSAPLDNGEYSEQVINQTHRFWDSKLQFDFGKCTDERGQMTGMFPEWSCARCVMICANQGIRRKNAVQFFYQKMKDMTSEASPILL
ncbi:hypothetical protein ACFLWR_03465 [Chloroflexota bacterium]